MTRKVDERIALILRTDQARPVSIRDKTVLVHDISRCAVDDWSSLRAAGVTVNETDRWDTHGGAMDRVAGLLWSYAIEAEYEGRAAEYIRGVVCRVRGYRGFAVGLMARHPAR